MATISAHGFTMAIDQDKTNKLRTQEKKKEAFASTVKTSVMFEKENEQNPWLADELYIGGYNYLELLEHCSHAEMIWLLLTQEIPNQSQLAQLNFLLNLPAAFGPRHQGVRAVMQAAVSKTHIQHLLPTGMMTSAGQVNGSEEITSCVKFVSTHSKTSVNSLSDTLLTQTATPDAFLQDEFNGIPGTGNLYGDQDKLVDTIMIKAVSCLSESSHLTWLKALKERLNQHNSGIRLPLVIAAYGLDMGLNHKQITLLFQLGLSPVLAAFGIEKSWESHTSMPFISDENYHMSQEAGGANHD